MMSATKPQQGQDIRKHEEDSETAAELEKKRQASRESSRRSRERERSKVEVKAHQLKLESENMRIRAENKRLRRFIQVIKEGSSNRKDSSSSTAVASCSNGAGGIVVPQPVPVVLPQNATTTSTFVSTDASSQLPSSNVTPVPSTQLRSDQNHQHSKKETTTSLSNKCS